MQRRTGWQQPTTKIQTGRQGDRNRDRARDTKVKAQHQTDTKRATGVIRHADTFTYRYVHSYIHTYIYTYIHT